MRIRSYLYCPANRPDLAAKAARTGADAIILDLEDSIPDSAKPAARESLDRLLLAGSDYGLPPVFVRLNPVPEAFDDLGSLTMATVRGVFLAKCESGDDIRAVDAALAAIEHSQNLAGGGIDIVPLIESVRGLYEAEQIIAASARVRRIAFGAGDFVQDLGGKQSPSRIETLFARSTIVALSRRMNIGAPIAHVHVPIDDVAGLARACEEDRALGFGARSCIHPRQIAPVNACFGWSDDDIAEAERIVAAYARAARDGRGAALLPDGVFIDRATLRWAQNILAVNRDHTAIGADGAGPV